MREDSDFDAYLAARWSSLVGGLSDDGLPLPEAERITLDALVRLRPHWRRIREREDVDAVVRREVGLLVERRRAGRPGSRAADVAGPPESTIPPTPQAVAVVVRSRRRTRWRTAGLVAAALLLVVGLSTWLLERSSDPEPGLASVPTSAGINPAPVAWYANGALHLDRVVLQLPPLRDLARVEGGAVYVDTTGAVVLVDVLGRRSSVGSTDLDSRVAVSADRSRIFFVDRTGSSLLVVDAGTGEMVAERALGGSAGSGPSTPGALIAVDGDVAFYRDATGTHAWTPGEPGATPVTPGTRRSSPPTAAGC